MHNGFFINIFDSMIKKAHSFFDMIYDVRRHIKILA